MHEDRNDDRYHNRSILFGMFAAALSGGVAGLIIGVIVGLWLGSSDCMNCH